MELNFRKLNNYDAILRLTKYTNIVCICQPGRNTRKNNDIRIYACLYHENIKGIIVILFYKCSKVEIIGISVDESVRGQGIGSYMLQQVNDKYSLKLLYAETDDDAVMF